MARLFDSILDSSSQSVGSDPLNCGAILDLDSDISPNENRSFPKVGEHDNNSANFRFDSVLGALENILTPERRKSKAEDCESATKKCHDFVVEESDKSSDNGDAEDNLEIYLQALKTPRETPTFDVPEETESLSDFITDDADESTADTSQAFYLRSLSERLTSKGVLKKIKSPHENKDPNEDDAVFEEFFHRENDESDKENRPPSTESTQKSDNSVNSAVQTFEPPKTGARKPRKAKGRMKTISSASSAEDEQQTAGNNAAEPEHFSEKKVTVTKSSFVSADERFLRSLSPTCPRHEICTEAENFLGKAFKNNRKPLVEKLYELFNRTVFGDRLDKQMPIEWNVRLRKTAGQCVYRIGGDRQRKCRVELAVKVLDTPVSADRVRDTLIHEMCHAAVWLISGDRNGGHGQLWKGWAYRAHGIFPQLPVIGRCHNYDIVAKFVYRCQTCKQEIHRHSKSLDTDRKVCGYCRGRFELLINSQRQKKVKNVATEALTTPKQPNKFALFVQENYGMIKKSQPGQVVKTHKEVMVILSGKFKQLST